MQLQENITLVYLYILKILVILFQIMSLKLEAYLCPNYKIEPKPSWSHSRECRCLDLLSILEAEDSKIAVNVAGAAKQLDASDTKAEKIYIVFENLNSGSSEGWEMVVDVLDSVFGKLYSNVLLILCIYFLVLFWNCNFKPMWTQEVNTERSNAVSEQSYGTAKSALLVKVFYQRKFDVLLKKCPESVNISFVASFLMVKCYNLFILGKNLMWTYEVHIANMHLIWLW